MNDATLRPRALWLENFAKNSDTGFEMFVVSGRRFHFGSEYLNGQLVPTILIPGRERPDVQAPGLRLQQINGKLGKDDKTETFLSIQCIDRALAPVFLRFLDEVFELVEGGAIFPAAIKEAFETWRHFLIAPRQPALTDAEILGLWGELWFLRSLLKERKDPFGIIKGWMGPDGHAWDFEVAVEGDPRRIEVKTTRSTKRAITVSNEHQLVVDAGFAWLCFIRVTESSSGQSLADLVDELLGQAHGTNAFKRSLSERLASAGYSEEHSETYRATKWVPAEETWFKVDSSFPVIRYDTLQMLIRERVSGLSYSLNLAGLEALSRPPFTDSPVS